MKYSARVTWTKWSCWLLCPIAPHTPYMLLFNSITFNRTFFYLILSNFIPINLFGAFYLLLFDKFVNFIFHHFISNIITFFISNFSFLANYAPNFLLFTNFTLIFFKQILHSTFALINQQVKFVSFLKILHSTFALINQQVNLFQLRMLTTWTIKERSKGCKAWTFPTGMIKSWV